MTDIVVPPTIDTLPSPPLPTDTPAEFDAKGFATVAALGPAVEQINAANAATHQNAAAANERAVAADASAGVATTQADLAMGYRNTAGAHAATAGGQADIATGAASTATTQAGIATDAAGTATTQSGLSDTARQQAQAAQDGAEEAADQARGYRDEAQVFATQQLVGASTTSLTPGAGSKTFAMEPGRAFVPGMYLVATSTGTPAARMAGYVSSYDSATGQLIINVDGFGGAGTYADWAIGVAVAGQVGGITTQRITANTAGVANVRYLIAAPGLKLTMPSTFAPGDTFAVSEEIGANALWQLDLGTHKLRSVVHGLVDVPANYSAVEWRYTDVTGGFA